MGTRPPGPQPLPHLQAADGEGVDAHRLPAVGPQRVLPEHVQPLVAELADPGRVAAGDRDKNQRAGT